MSLKNSLLQYIRDSGKEWVSKKELADFARSLGPLGETAGRRLRELVKDDKKLERSKEYYASYRLIQNTGVPAALSQAQTLIEESGPEPLLTYQESLPEKPYARPTKMPKLWLSLRSKYRSPLPQRNEAGSSERYDESTDLVRELSRSKDLAGISGGAKL